MRSGELELSAARLLWDLEEAGVAAGVPTLSFSWAGEWPSHYGQFLKIKRLVRHMVTVSWRYGRPPKRPNEDLVWDGKSWHSQSTSWQLQRQLTGVTQKEVAAASRLSVRAVRAIEKGDRVPTSPEKKLLAIGFNRLRRKYNLAVAESQEGSR